jgi:hypothetical protein
VTTALESHDEEILDAARRALRGCGGAEALGSLGWWELLPELADERARAAVFALCRAHGRELADTIALGSLAAQPYVEAAGAQPGSIVAVFTRRSARRGVVGVAIGDVSGLQLLVDRPGAGVWLVDAEAIALRPIEIPGRLAIHEIAPGSGRERRFLGEDAALAARARSAFLGRVALAHELLGAAEGALALAVAHARAREQFGEPIARFQAVRHLLAWAATDCAAIASTASEAAALDAAAPPRYDEIAKAIAGRNARRCCERALQVLGAVGFTADHEHHHFHSRVLALDALLGSGAQLARELGAWLRATRSDPGLASAILLGAGARGHPT